MRNLLSATKDFLCPVSVQSCTHMNVILCPCSTSFSALYTAHSLSETSETNEGAYACMAGFARSNALARAKKILAYEISNLSGSFTALRLNFQPMHKVVIK